MNGTLLLPELLSARLSEVSGLGLLGDGHASACHTRARAFDKELTLFVHGIPKLSERNASIVDLFDAR